MKTLKELYEIVKAAGGDFPFEVRFRGMKVFFTVLAIDTFGNEYVVGQWRDGSVGKKLLDQPDWQFPKDSPYLKPEPQSINESDTNSKIVIDDKEYYVMSSKTKIERQGKQVTTNKSLELSRIDFDAPDEFEGLDPVVYATADSDFKRTMDEFKIKHNRQRWEDMGRPWGRLKKGAELYHSKFENVYEFSSFDKDPMGVLVFEEGYLNCERRLLSQEFLNPSDKTLLNLDDWLEVEQEQPTMDDKIRMVNNQFIKALHTSNQAMKSLSDAFKTCQFCKGKKELTWETNVKVDSDCIHVNRTAKNITLSMPCPYCYPGAFKCTD